MTPKKDVLQSSQEHDADAYSAENIFSKNQDGPNNYDDSSQKILYHEDRETNEEDDQTVGYFGRFTGMFFGQTTSANQHDQSETSAATTSVKQALDHQKRRHSQGHREG